MEDKIINSAQRDYDKEPIVIVDRMPEISFWGIMIFVIIAVFIIDFFVPTNKNVDINEMIVYFVIMYLPVFYFIKSRIKKHRKIILYNSNIIREWDDETIKIDLNDIKEIKKSFIDFYNGRQKALTLYIPIYYLLLPLSILFQHSTLVVVKYVYKLFKGFSNKTLFDTVVIFDDNDEMIAIFIPTNELKDELNNYFLEKGYGDIDKLSIFYTNQYSPDELTHYFNKKDN